MDSCQGGQELTSASGVSRRSCLAQLSGHWTGPNIVSTRSAPFVLPALVYQRPRLASKAAHKLNESKRGSPAPGPGSRSLSLMTLRAADQFASICLRNFLYSTHLQRLNWRLLQVVALHKILCASASLSLPSSFTLAPAPDCNSSPLDSVGELIQLGPRWGRTHTRSARGWSVAAPKP